MKYELLFFDILRYALHNFKLFCSIASTDSGIEEKLTCKKYEEVISLIAEVWTDGDTARAENLVWDFATDRCGDFEGFADIKDSNPFDK